MFSWNHCEVACSQQSGNLNVETLFVSVMSAEKKYLTCGYRWKIQWMDDRKRLLCMDALELLRTIAMCVCYLELQSLRLANGLRARDSARFAVGRLHAQSWCRRAQDVAAVTQRVALLHLEPRWVGTAGHSTERGLICPHRPQANGPPCHPCQWGPVPSA